MVRPDGEIRFVHEEVGSAGDEKDLLWGTIQDMTELKKIEPAKELAEVFMHSPRKLLDSIHKDGIAPLEEIL